MLRVILIAFLMSTFPASAAPFDHAPYEAIVRTCVHDGKVDYEAIRLHHAAALKAYVQSLGEADPSKMTSDEQLAFWLNAYNALVISAIVEGSSPEPTVGRAAFFFGRRFHIAGKDRTLDDIESNTVRAVFRDPRVHFALVCGSRGCPVVRTYEGGGVQATLDEGTRLFMRDPSKVRLDRAKHVLYLSSLFKWYEGDFKKAGTTPVAFVSRYLADDDRATLAEGKWDVVYMPYDWSLNGVPPKVSTGGTAAPVEEPKF